MCMQRMPLVRTCAQTHVPGELRVHLNAGPHTGSGKALGLPCASDSKGRGQCPLQMAPWESPRHMPYSLTRKTQLDLVERGAGGVGWGRRINKSFNNFRSQMFSTFTMCLALCGGSTVNKTDMIPARETDYGDKSYHLSTTCHVVRYFVYFGSLSMTHNPFRWGLLTTPIF